jgi:hypothetical protein
MKIGTISRKPGYLYYVDGDGSIFQMARGTKTKTKVGKFSRPAGCMCWVDGAGNVECKKR